MKKPVSLLLFLVLPLGIFWLTGIAAINHRQKLLWSEAESKLNRQVETIINFLEPSSFMQNLFDNFTTELYSQEITPERLRDLTANYCNGNLKFEPCIFIDGSLLNEKQLCLDDLPITRIWEYMHDEKATEKDLFFHIKTKVRSRLGPLFSILKMKNHPRTVMEFSGKSGSGTIYYYPQNNQNGALLIAWKLPTPQTLEKYIPDSIKSNLQLSIETRQNVSSQNSSQQKNETQPIAKKIFNGFEIEVRGDFPELKLDHVQVLAITLLLLLSAFLIALFRYATINDSLANLPIKWKLIGLSLYTIIFPLIGFAYFGWKMTTEHRALLKQEATNACLESINEVDSGFERELEEILRFYRTLVLQFQDNKTKEEIFNYFEELKKLEEVNWVEFRDINANTVVTTQNPKTSEKIGIVGKVFARHGITNYLAHKLPPQQKLLPSASEILIQEFLESPFGGWARVFESPDDLSLITFGGRDLLWYWNVYPDNIDHAAFMVCDTHLHWAIQSYLKRLLVRRVAHKQAALRLLAWSKQTSSTFPGNEKFTGDLAGFIYQIRRNSQPQTTELEWNQQKWLVAGSPGKRLKEHILIALYPANEIDRQLHRLEKDIAWAAIFAVFLAILTGMLFSHTLIEPVSQLMIGVNAIRNRDVSKHVDIVQNDEFGKLSKTFNQTIETLADIIGAQKIQEMIISNQVPEINGLQTAITYLPASDLGGDYCDIQEIADNEWLLAIGAVTGHGVSSALVTAMTKAIVSEQLSSGKVELCELFACINELLFQQFRQSKCMSMLMIRIDIKNGKCQAINAGHPSPIKISENGAELVNLPASSPLGFAEKMAENPIVEFSLNRNDMIVMYTEAILKAGEKEALPLGKEGLRKLCLLNADKQAEEVGQNIVSEVQRLNQHKFEDDLTLLILRKVAPENFAN
jgi:serine phosphatase RsbU (regulator of sigma subunit)